MPRPRAGHARPLQSPRGMPGPYKVPGHARPLQSPRGMPGPYEVPGHSTASLLQVILGIFGQYLCLG